MIANQEQRMLSGELRTLVTSLWHWRKSWYNSRNRSIHLNSAVLLSPFLAAREGEYDNYCTLYNFIGTLLINLSPS